MENQETRITLARFRIAVVVACWITLTYVLVKAVGLHHGWPAYMVLIFWLAYGKDNKKLWNIIPGALVGLLAAFAIRPLVGSMLPVIGSLTVAIPIALFILLFGLLIFGDVLPKLFNDSTFAWFSIAISFPDITIQDTLENAVVTAVGGTFLVMGVWHTMKNILIFLAKRQAKKQDQKEQVAA